MSGRNRAHGASAAGLAALAAGAALLVVSCNPREMAAGRSGIRRLSIATGNTGGVYYPYGGGLAKVISETIPDVEATAEVTAASVDNLKLLQNRQADIAFTLADSLDDAVRGEGAFADFGAVDVRTLAVLYANYTHLVTVTSSGIARISDLRGRVVSLGSPGSGTEIIARRVLEATNLDPSADIRAQSLNTTASVDALKDGKIDAFFWSGGLPTAAVLDLASTAGVTLRLVANDEVLDTLRGRYGEALYDRLVIPASAYPGLTADVPVIGVNNMLVVSAALEDDLAYDVTRVLFDRQEALIAIHPEAEKLTLASAVGASPAPFHAGAIRYYRERGAWKE